MTLPRGAARGGAGRARAFEARIHGRGGQGVVTAAEMLSVAAFEEGRFAQAFPSFGSERMGAPVVAFCRIDDHEIRTREPIVDPDALIVQDATLVHQVDLFAGLRPDGYILINAARAVDALGLGPHRRRFRHERMLTVPATEIALRRIGVPIPNTVLLGGLAALAGIISLDALAAAPAPTVSRRPGARPTSPPPTRPTRGSPESGRSLRMRRQIEGSRAVAEAVAACRPEVVCAYPITPQTHIVEAPRRAGEHRGARPCAFVNVESEFAAMSVAIGASATGARAYTATASQGLLFMSEAVYNAAGLGLPIVMTVANRAIGAPDQHLERPLRRDGRSGTPGGSSSSPRPTRKRSTCTSRPSGWPRSSRCPVMVCMDGFVLTHAMERFDVPDQAAVDAFLPPFEPRQVLDPDDPVTHRGHGRTRGLHRSPLPGPPPPASTPSSGIPAIAAEFRAAFGRESAGCVAPVSLRRAPRPWWWPWARCSGPSRTRSTSCGDAAIAVGVLG